MPARLEAGGARQGFTEDQASPVVESFEGLRIELVEATLLAPGLGSGAFGRSPSGMRLTEDAVQSAARDECRVWE